MAKPIVGTSDDLCTALAEEVCRVKRLNLYEMYSLGKQLSALSDISSDSKVNDSLFSLWFGREALEEAVADNSPLLGSARRAARTLIASITQAIPEDIKEAMARDKDEKLTWRATGISNGVAALESVLRNEMPDIAAYVVSQKGIFRTDDLIAHAENQLSVEVRKALPKITCFDIQQAGKCLAYELATACAFHLWRAVESAMGHYYLSLSGKTFEQNGVQKNWGAYIKALNESNANQEITVFLNHIKNQYRNPQAHPDEIVEIDDALGLFTIAINTVDLLMRAVLARQSEPMPIPAGIAAALLKGD